MTAPVVRIGVLSRRTYDARPNEDGRKRAEVVVEEKDATVTPLARVQMQEIAN